jgi:hypothetical protein
MLMKNTVENGGHPVVGTEKAVVAGAKSRFTQ